MSEFCPNCGIDVSTGLSICPRCGADVPNNEGINVDLKDSALEGINKNKDNIKPVILPGEVKSDLPPVDLANESLSDADAANKYEFVNGNVSGEIMANPLELADNPNMMPNQPGIMPNPNMNTNQPGMMPNPNMITNQSGMMPNPNMMPNQPGMMPNPNLMPNQPGMMPNPNMMPNQPGVLPNPNMMPNNQNVYYGETNNKAENGGSPVLGILGMIFGIVGLLITIATKIGGIQFSIAGFVLSIIGLSRKRGHGMALAGSICSGLGFLLFLIGVANL